MIPPAGVLMGAVAFGVWWQNLAAALFAGIGLFFLAGIYKTTERMLATTRRSEGEPHSRACFINRFSLTSSTYV